MTHLASPNYHNVKKSNSLVELAKGVYSERTKRFKTNERNKLVI